MSQFKGFAGTPQKIEPARVDEYFSCGVLALVSGNLEEAFLSFSQLTDDSAALFNLALCHYKAGMLEKAIAHLTRAEKLISIKSTPMPQSQPIPAEITQYDGSGDGYRMPMAKAAPELFPEQSRIRISRLLADIYGELGYEQEFLRILPIFSKQNYKNIADIKLKFSEKKV